MGHLNSFDQNSATRLSTSGTLLVYKNGLDSVPTRNDPSTALIIVRSNARHTAHPLFRLRQSRFPISFAPWLAQCALSHFTSSARPTSVDVMSAIGGTVVKVGHHPIVTTKRRASSAAFKCSISSNMPLTTTPFLNAMKPRWTPWPQHADLTPGKKPIHGSHPSVFCR